MFHQEDLTHPQTVESAREILAGSILPIEDTESKTLYDAVGGILAEDVTAKVAQPPFQRSPLDGYALRGEDTKGASKKHPVRIRVIDHVMAGYVSGGNVTPGTAIRIMTGAPVPAGANAVLRQEDTDCGEETVEVYAELAPGSNIVPVGEDFQEGSLIARKGDVIASDLAGAIAAAGVSKIAVYRRPRVAVMTSGDELMDPGQPLLPGKIYNSNQTVLAGRLKEWKIGLSEVVSLKDEPESCAEQIRRAAKRSDLIITTGGVSVGQKDIMHDVWKILGAKRLFWRVGIKPGAPTLAFVFEDTLVIALSGNPFAALVNLELLAGPVLAKMAKDPRILPGKETAVVTRDFHGGGKVRRIVRAYVENGTVTLPLHKQLSGRLLAEEHTNCYADIPAELTDVPAGSRLTVWIPGRF